MTTRHGSTNHFGLERQSVGKTTRAEASEELEIIQIFVPMRILFFGIIEF